MAETKDDDDAVDFEYVSISPEVQTKTLPFDSNRHAGNLSVWITAAFVVNITAWTLFTACVYGRIMENPTELQLKLVERVSAWIQALAAVLSGQLGYVLAYYFHKRDSEGNRRN